jgi:hypothetical protein
MFPVFESKNIIYKHASYKELVNGIISKYLQSGGKMRKTKTRLYFYDSRQNEISESITYYPEILNPDKPLT